MAMPNFQSGYFALENPLYVFERWLHRCSYRQQVTINRRQVEVGWTWRAERELRRRQRPLVVEMQLYFSCMVKKRLLFHDDVDFETVDVNKYLALGFRPIASAACDPHEFAANFPAARTLADGRALNMVPQRLQIDFRRGRWHGRFLYGA